MTSPMPSLPEPPLVFHDGQCSLCNALVRALLRLDRRGALRFAPLQGETARLRLPPALRFEPATIVLLDGAGLSLRSEALLRIGGHLGGGWRAAAGVARWIPRAWRDWGYVQVARRRAALFGRRAVCPLPTGAARGRLLP
jgi:predicted DCC family thiol-disulfide oxidoreductase YuxK